MAPLRLSALLLLAPLAARSTMYDIVMPAYRPPEGCECAAWNASTAQSWAAGAVPADAGSSCAMPAAIVDGKIGVTTSYSGPWCYCKGSGAPATCLAPESTPEQINLQLAEPSVVVVGFVTYEQSVPSDAPMAMFGRKGGAQKQATGVSHEYYATWYSPPRNYSMHFVKFSGLQPRASYTYKVRSTLTLVCTHFLYTSHAPCAQGALRGERRAVVQRVHLPRPLPSGRHEGRDLRGHGPQPVQQHEEPAAGLRRGHDRRHRPHGRPCLCAPTPGLLHGLYHPVSSCLTRQLTGPQIIWARMAAEEATRTSTRISPS